jgi:hypothetical protein
VEYVSATDGKSYEAAFSRKKDKKTEFYTFFITETDKNRRDSRGFRCVKEKSDEGKE